MKQQHIPLVLLVIAAPLSLMVLPYPWGILGTAICVFGIVFLESKRELQEKIKVEQAQDTARSVLLREIAQKRRQKD